MWSRAALIALFTLACGGDDDDTPDAPADASPADASGPGSGTLQVEGAFVVSNPANAGDGASLRVDCEVRLSKDGQPVTTAQVRVNPAPPALQVQLIGEELDPSHYVGYYTSYSDTARISISSGDDYVSEITLVGATMFQIEMPTSNFTVPMGEGLHVTWAQPGGAASRADVELETGFQAVDLADPGVYDVPAGELMMGSDRVIVTRWRENALGVGAAPGSYVDFGVRSEQAFQVE